MRYLPSTPVIRGLCGGYYVLQVPFVLLGIVQTVAGLVAANQSLGVAVISIRVFYILVAFLGGVVGWRLIYDAPRSSRHALLFAYFGVGLGVIELTWTICDSVGVHQILPSYFEPN